MAVVGRMTIDQLERLVRATRSQHFSSNEGIFRSPPMCFVGEDDHRFFLQNFTHTVIDDKLETFVCFAHPALITEAKNRALNVFIDATFKIVPSGYKQCLILMVYSASKDKYFPVFYILMTGKSYNCYFYALGLAIAASDFTLKAISVTCDFEKPLIKAVKSQFKEATLIGCLFHWKQALVRKLKDLGIPDQVIYDLCNKKGPINLLTVEDPSLFESHVIPYIRESWEKNLPYKTKFDNFWTYFRQTWLTQYDVKVKYMFLFDPF